MTTAPQPRIPEGTPTGGRFAAVEHRDADVQLPGPGAAPGTPEHRLCAHCRGTGQIAWHGLCNLCGGFGTVDPDDDTVLRDGRELSGEEAFLASLPDSDFDADGRPILLPEAS